MGKFIDLTGQKFGRLTVIERDVSRNGKSYWKCLCECGNIKSVYGCNIKRGITKSCGCYSIDLMLGRSWKHGHSDMHRTIPEYQTWLGIKSRCYNENERNFINYGGRGITVCERWKSDFNAFFDDMGLRPSPIHSIDREDVNGNYEPSNCKWATREEQARNKRISKINKSGTSGVNFHKAVKRWVARITYDNKRIHLGNFEHIEDAIQARKDAELKYWGTESP